MNSLFGQGIKQIQTIKKDLEYYETNYETAPLSTKGQISVSLNNLQRTINELSELILKETNEENKTKYNKRLSKFRSELAEFRTRFDKVKQLKETTQLENNKSELLNRHKKNAAVNSVNSTTSADNPFSQSPMRTMSAQEHLYNDRQSLGRSSRQLDEIIEMGQKSFDDILIQNEYLQRFEKKLASSLSTLGVSRSTIERVERRVYKDRFVFFGGAFAMFLCFYLIYKYL